MEPLLYSADIPWSTHSYICVIDCSSLFVAHTFFFSCSFLFVFFFYNRSAGLSRGNAGPQLSQSMKIMFQRMMTTTCC